MNAKFFVLNLTLLLITGCSGAVEVKPQVHHHFFDDTTLEWSWNKSSTGYLCSASIECSECEETFTKNASIKEEITVKPTCNAGGEKKYTARVQFGEKDYFDTKQIALSMTGHSSSDHYTFDENKHYLSCVYCGDLLLEENHDFSEFVIDIEPQLGYYGSKSRVCEICGYKDVQIINKEIPSIADVKAAIDVLPAVNQIKVYNYEDIAHAVEMFDYLDDESISQLGSSYISKINSLKDMLENKYGIALKLKEDVSTTKLNADLSINGAFKQTYGDVLKLVGNNDGWTELMLDSSLPEDAYEVKFAVYVSQPTDMSLSLNRDCSNTYDFANRVFTNKNASENKLTLSVNTWTEFTMPASDFAKAGYFGLYCTSQGTPYGITKGFPGYVTNFYVIKKGYYRKSAAELISLIDSLPAATSLNPYSYSKLSTISTNLDMYDDDEKSLITNLSKFNAYKTAWDNKYTLVYDPSINGLPGGNGGSIGTSGNFSIGYDEAYGTVLEVNLSFDSNVAGSNYLQAYFYDLHERSFNANDKLIFSVKSPFETVPNTSQSVWVGRDDKATKFNLVKNTWVEVKGTGSELNSSGELSTDFSKSAISLQRYDMNHTFGSFSGTYLLTCIIAEKGN